VEYKFVSSRRANDNKTMVNIYVDCFPNECPICHHFIHNNGAKNQAIKYNDDGMYEIDMTFQCPQCQNAFMGKYRCINTENQNDRKFDLLDIFPKQCNEKFFENEIQKISPEFVKIYNQSICAETNELNEVSGMGLRKAFEFLIKDYLISKNTDESSKIKKLLLSQCISQYIDNERLKEIAKRVTWLGNDETHYVRTWEEQDINDLKALIDIAVSWIHTELLADKYMIDMSSKNISN